VSQRLALWPCSTISEFERAFDQVFEDLLISRWRGPSRGAAFDNPFVVDKGAQYEIRIAATGADPRQTEVEVSERRLLVRMPGAAGVKQSAFEFPYPVDAEGVTARLDRGVLVIILPKKQGRKIEVE
jgi:HSP20 family molecular chaperone IbpA